MTNQEAEAALDLVAFWHRAGPAKWYSRDDAFDDACGSYRALWDRAANGGLTEWRATATGSLAYILLTDQIPRNIFRGEAKQFQTDAIALDAARHGLAHGHHRAQAMPMQNFYLLPFEHAEDLAVQEEGLDHFRAAGHQDSYYWALVHYDAIRRFGRFPHRNAILGRDTTPEEARYLATGGFGT